MKILQLCVGMIQTNCYIVYDEATMEGAVIDPGANGADICRELDQAGVKCTWVLLTHGHFDHLLAVHDVQAHTGAKLAIHKGDAWMLEPAALDRELRSFGLPKSGYDALRPDLLAEEGSEIRIGGLIARYLHTPGHTPGSSCIQMGDVLFTGDTLFRHECGRCDLEGGNFDEMLRSLARLYGLPGDYQVLPGHDACSTLADERRWNPYMLQATRK